MSGSGTLTDPWDLTTAFASDIVSNSLTTNRTLWILDGTTSDGTLTLSLNGENGRTVTIRPYQTANPKLNGSLTLNGSYWTLKNVEIFWNGWTTRQSAQSGSYPTDIIMKDLGGGGTYVKLVNCIIHDLRSPYFSESTLGMEFHGCIIYHIGWSGPDRGHGHGLYLHNQSPIKTVKDCIIFNNFGWGIHAYSTVGSDLQNFRFIGNTCFNAGSLYGASYRNFLLGADSGAADTAEFISNMSHGAGGLQFYGNGAINVTLTDNYMPDGKTGSYTAISESGNYWGAAIGNQVFLRANDYDANRANLTIYNQDQTSSIVVDVSSVFSPGNSINARNVQDYFVDVQSLTVADNGTITVNMQAINRTVATPVQWSAPSTTFPQFGCFVLERV